MKRLISLRDRDIDKPFDMRSEFARGTGPMIWSLTNHTVELARTVVDLSAADRMVVALPLIRLCMENAMTAAWLLISPRAVDATVHEGMRQRRAAIRDLLDQGIEGFDADSMAAAESAVGEFAQGKSPEGQHIDRRFKAMKGGAKMYVSYRVASSLSHAGMTLGDFYLEEVPVSLAAPAGLAFMPNKKMDSHEAWVGTAASMLVVAMTACDRTDSKRSQKNQLVKAAATLQIDTDFQLVDPPSVV